MSRSTRIILPGEKTDDVVQALRPVDGLINMTLQRGAALDPPRDVLTVESTTEALAGVLRRLDERGVLRDPNASVTTTEPASTISITAADAIANDYSDASLEEIEQTLGKESNMSGSGMLLMACAGVIASIGLLTDALHLVIAAAIIAPGFEPLSRVSLGLVGHGRAWLRGLGSALRAYAVLITAALATTLLYDAFGFSPGRSSYLENNPLIAYWSKPSLLAAVVSGAAGIAGATLVATGRSVLTGGVLIALALIPSGTLIGLGTAGLDGPFVLGALQRLTSDIVLVLIGSAVVFGYKRAATQRRRMVS